MPSMLGLGAAPGQFGVPSGGSIKLPSGGTPPRGIPQDRIVSYHYPAAGVFAAGVANSAASAPAAQPATWMNLYVRKTGSDNNGGSSAAVSPDQTGADGVTNGTTTFTSAGANFTQADVNKLINIVTKGRYRVTAVGSTSSITLSGSPSAGSSLTWNLGGAVLTIGALLANTTAAVLGGDRIWIGAGVYRETVTITLTPTFDLRIEGDNDGTMTGDPGIVQWTAYTTNDKTAPTGSVPITLNSKNNLTFANLFLVSGSGGAVTAGATSQNVNWINCAFQAGAVANAGLFTITAGFQVPLTWLFDRCLFLLGNKRVLDISMVTGTGTDWDVNVVVRNCMIISALGTLLNASGSGGSANKGGGIRFRDCFGLATQAIATGVAVSSSIPCTLNGSVFLCCGNGITVVNASATGQIIEDANLMQANPARTNVIAGSRSTSDGSYAPLIHFGQERLAGLVQRMFGEPYASSPLLGFGGDLLATDLLGRVRPGGGGSALAAVGPMERGNTFGKETGTVQTGANAISITGPGYHDFDVPVGAQATTISIYLRRDSTYTGPWPEAILTGYECGVSTLVARMTVPSDTYEKVTFPPFTATSDGIVTLRIASYDTNGAGHVYADTFAQA